MQPITCYAGYPMPLAMVGRSLRIVGFQATVEATGTASRVTIVDDENIEPGKHKFGNLLTSTQAIERNTQIIDKKGIASVSNNGTLECFFPYPITLRHGPSVYATNIQGGTLKLFYM